MVVVKYPRLRRENYDDSRYTRHEKMTKWDSNGTSEENFWSTILFMGKGIHVHMYVSLHVCFLIFVHVISLSSLSLTRQNWILNHWQGCVTLSVFLNILLTLFVLWVMTIGTRFEKINKLSMKLSKEERDVHWKRRIKLKVPCSLILSVPRPLTICFWRKPKKIQRRGSEWF